jgi:hypothetical protein
MNRFRGRARCAAASVLFLSVVSLALGAPPPPDDDGCGKAHALWQRFAAGLNVTDDDGREGPGGPRGDLDQTDVLHNDIDIEVNPAGATITGSNTMTIRSLVNGLTQFTFRLRNNFTITEALINGVVNIPPASIQQTANYGRLIGLDRAYFAGEEFTLLISFTGPAVSRGFGSIEFASQNGVPLIYTLSEPYYAATWWPCKDGGQSEPGDNADKATLTLAITAPAALKTVSAGLFQGFDELSGSRRRYRWASSYPIATYLVFFSTTNYNQWSQTYSYPLPGGGTGTMPVEFSIYPAADTPGNRAAWELCLPMLEAFRPVFGLYPFVDEKYGIYQFGFSGGMEHQTYTGQGAFGETLTAHELAHQWWGDNVTCRTWHDIWLNEGFATYGEAIWHERKPGSSGLPALHAHMAARRPSAVGDSVYVYDTADFNRIFSSTYSYRKAGWVLHMLRHVVGDATFFQILADYREAFQGSAATTDDFAAVASATSGRDLTGFFERWIYGIGAPTYRYAVQPATIDGQSYLRLYVSQSQQPSYGVYDMPIDVRVDYDHGVQTTVIRNDAIAEHFVIPLPGPAMSVMLDEFNWILNEGKLPVGWMNGPPKIVRTAPAPGASFPQSAAPSQVRITFSENVTAAPTDFSVLRGGSSVPFTLAYDAANFAATLSFTAALASGDYSVTINDSVNSTAAAIMLDGELPGSTLASVLPSGDGLAGGDAVLTFRVRPACPADLDNDGAIGLADLTILLAHYGTSSGATAADGDLDADGDVDISDLTLLLSGYGTLCPP